MINHLPSGAIHVTDLELWAHVGVLEKERLHGQLFRLDFSIWLDLERSATEDNLDFSVDYALAINALQKLSFEIKCLTIEYFSNEILNCLEKLYGPVPMKVLLRKCFAPVPGFTGTVAIERKRHGCF